MSETTSPATVPDPIASPGIHRDKISREIRFEFAPQRREIPPGLVGSVYDLTIEEQRTLLLEGHLPGWGQFLPDFAIVYATGDPNPDGTATWTDLHLHVGGVRWPDEENEALTRDRYLPRDSRSAEWRGLDVLVHGDRFGRKYAAPAWLLDLIRAHTPWGYLIDDSVASGPKERW